MHRSVRLRCIPQQVQDQYQLGCQLEKPTCCYCGSSWYSIQVEGSQKPLLLVGLVGLKESEQFQFPQQWLKDSHHAGETQWIISMSIILARKHRATPMLVLVVLRSGDTGVGRHSTGGTQELQSDSRSCRRKTKVVKRLQAHNLLELKSINFID